VSDTINTRGKRKSKPRKDKTVNDKHMEKEMNTPPGRPGLIFSIPQRNDNYEEVCALLDEVMDYGIQSKWEIKAISFEEAQDIMEDSGLEYRCLGIWDMAYELTWSDGSRALLLCDYSDCVSRSDLVHAHQSALLARKRSLEARSRRKGDVS
jgi:hypothetical protein